MVLVWMRHGNDNEPKKKRKRKGNPYKYGHHPHDDGDSSSSSSESTEEEKSYHAHDVHLNPEKIYKIKDFAKKFVKRFGVPDEIYLSPFQRCLATYRLMKPYITSDKKKTIVKVHPSLGRYFQKREQRKPDVSRKTLKYGIRIKESFEEFTQRVKRFSKKMEQQGALERKKLILVIAHTLVLKEAANFYDSSEMTGYLEFLQYFSVRE